MLLPPGCLIERDDDNKERYERRWRWKAGNVSGQLRSDTCEKSVEKRVEGRRVLSTSFDAAAKFKKITLDTCTLAASTSFPESVDSLGKSGKIH